MPPLGNKLPSARLGIALVLERVRKSLLLVGIDGPVFYTLLWRIWMAVSGLVAIVLLPLLLTPVQQGYYFTFDSLINLKILFELGFSIVITQFASHEMAALHWTGTGIATGNGVAKSRLASLLGLAVKWYCYAALFIAATLIPGGIWFFQGGQANHPTFSWMFPWIFLVFVTASNLILSPLFALLEGCGAVREIARMRVIEVAITSFTLWASLLAKAGLFAMAFSGAAGLTWQCYWLYSNHRHFLRDLRQTKTDIHGFNWVKDILPLQWRIAASWVSGYCVHSSITPIVFRANGPELAGKVGMSLLIAQGILTLSIAVVKTKVPRFGFLIAQTKFQELDSLYRRVSRQALSFAVLGSALFFGATLVMSSLGFSFRRRLLDPLPLLMILAATIINSLFQSQALYLRAHKTEPFLTLALVDAGVSMPLYYLAARYAGATGVAFSFLAISAAAGGVWANFIFYRFRAARTDFVIISS